MSEFSVLDYLKSIFKDWDSFRSFVHSLLNREEGTAQEFYAAAADSAETIEETPVPVTEVEPERVPADSSGSFRSFPWRILLVLIMILTAQRTFEPPRNSANLGIALYIMAFGIALWSFIRGEWNLTPAANFENGQISNEIRKWPFLLSILFSTAAFATLGGNKFTATNVTLWVFAIISHLAAFWQGGSQGTSLKTGLDSLNALFTKKEWTIRITRYGLLIFGLVVLIVLFRMHRLNSVAPEMTSDHAEKLMDVYDITQGQYSIYFPRNTGREPLYIYLCALFVGITDISFLTLKVVAVIGGLLTLPYIYLLGKEFGSKRIGLLAMMFAGIGYWPTVIERFGLRISFYPLFAAPTLYYIIRGLRRENRNDFVLAGIALGLGLNGYTPFRIVPFVVVALFGLYLLHARDWQARKQALIWLAVVGLTSWVFFIPQARYAVENPDMFVFRAFSRLSTVERPLPAPLWQLLPLNLWNASKQFNWDNGGIWVHSVPGRPGLDVATGALFLLGVSLILFRYIRSRNWMDLMLLLAAPLLQMPSTLSLAFPNENPSLSRTGGAIAPVFVLIAIGLDSVLNGINSRKRSAEENPVTNEQGSSLGRQPALTVFLVAVLFLSSLAQSYNLVFNIYAEQYRASSWNSSEMGDVIREFKNQYGQTDTFWIVPFPYWVDTRLPGFWAGIPNRDFALWPEQLEESLDKPLPKMFIFWPEDTETENKLKTLYPNGVLSRYVSSFPDRDFMLFKVEK